MSSDLMSAMGAAATGLRAQTVRIRIAAEKAAKAGRNAASGWADSRGGRSRWGLQEALGASGA